MLSQKLGLSIYVSIWPDLPLEVAYYFTDGFASQRLVPSPPLKNTDPKVDLLEMCSITEGFHIVVTDYAEPSPGEHVPTYHQEAGFIHLGFTPEQYAVARGE